MFWLFSVLTNFKETEGGTSLFALNIGLNCYFSPHSCRAHSGFCYRLWYYIWNSTYYYYYYIYYYYILLLLYLLFINYIIYLLLLYYSYLCYYYITPHITIVSYLITALKTDGNCSYTLKKLMTPY